MQALSGRANSWLSDQEPYVKARSSLDKAVNKLYQAKVFNSPMERVQCLFQRYAEATGIAEA